MLRIPSLLLLRKTALPPVTLIGHAFSTIGRSEHLRTVWRALTSAGIVAKIYDLTRTEIPEQAIQEEFGAHLVSEIQESIRIFHLNGADMANALPLLEQRQPGYFRRGHNIAYPAWELPRYPDVWARELDKFDEVWTPTAFVDGSIRPAVKVPVFHLKNACEPHIEAGLSRSYFSIPEDRFVILVAFDLRSFTSRKNPWAAIDAFRLLAQARPTASIQLVLKLSHSSHDAPVVSKIYEAVADLGDRVTVIDAVLTNNEIKNLIQNCDCFLSLHRSEGFGRGPAEAMFLGKPVVATGWSGNMEYMNPSVSFPVGYRLVPVEEGEYLYPEGQFWAEPDVEQAAEVLIRLVDNPAHGRAIGKRASAHMRRNFSNRVLGAKYRKRMQAIVRALPQTPTASQSVFGAGLRRTVRDFASRLTRSRNTEA